MPWLCLQEETQYPPAWAIVDSSAHQVCMDAKCLIAVFFLFCKGNSCSAWINFQSERPAFCISSNQRQTMAVPFAFD